MGRSCRYTYTPTYRYAAAEGLGCGCAEQDDLCLRRGPGLYQRAQDLAGGNLSSAIASALRRFVDVEEGRREGFDEIVVRVGPEPGRKVRFVGVLLGEWMDTSQAASRPFASTAAGPGIRPPRRAQPGLHDPSTAKASRPAGVPARHRLERQLRDVAGRGDARRRRDARGAARADPARSSTRWSPAPPASPPSRTSTSSRRPLRRGPEELPHDDHRSTAAIRVSRLRKSYGSTSCSTASTSRRRRLRVRPARPERRRQDDHRAHPLDAHPGRRGRRRGCRPRLARPEASAPRSASPASSRRSTACTGAENLQLMADLRPPRQGRRAAPRSRTARAVRPRRRRAPSRSPTYSGGMQRRLDLAMTLVGNPRIIFLDEPTAGLDPRSRRTMWQIDPRPRRRTASRSS